MKNQFPNATSDLLFDFVNEARLSPAVLVDRATTASYIGPDGKMQIAPAHTPRFNYDAKTGMCLGLLAEQTRTNTFRNSKNMLDTANWFLTNTSLVKVSGERWDDTFLLSPVDTSVGHEYPLIRSSFNSIATNALSTLSIRVKSMGAKAVRLQRNGYDNNYSRIDFNFETQKFSAAYASGISVLESYSAVDEGNGWWRLWMTSIARTDVSVANQMISFSPVYSTPTASPSDKILLAHPQHEAGSGTTSYIETTGSAVQRGGDNIWLPLPVKIGNAVTMVAQWDVPALYSRRPLSLLSTDNNDIISFFGNTSSRIGAGSATSVKNGVDLNVGNFANKNPGAVVRVALTADSSTFRCCNNFDRTVVSTAGSIIGSNMNLLGLGSYNSNKSSAMNSHLQKAMLFYKSVSDTELKALSKLEVTYEE